jgi:hypothetical protein
VACSTHRSCVKWGFLEQYLHRIVFAISVFHAYGHEWPCQCIYHPRKCKRFGLSDGEGCERLWHAISKLIAYLRVCGVCVSFLGLSSNNFLCYSSITCGYIHWTPRSNMRIVKVFMDWGSG